MVDIVQLVFQDRVIVEEVDWQVVVLIPKGVGYYRVIGIMEVIWKSVVVILNRRFTAVITCPDFLHGFRAGCGMGTVTLKVKLLYQVDALRDAVLYAIFLDLHKSYNASDRSMCMGILKGCGMGPRALFPL